MITEELESMDKLSSIADDPLALPAIEIRQIALQYRLFAALLILGITWSTYDGIKLAGFDVFDAATNKFRDAAQAGDHLTSLTYRHRCCTSGAHTY